MLLTLFSLTLLFVFATNGEENSKYDTDEILGYHFHTYFFQNTQSSTQEALALRVGIQEQIENGNLANCLVSEVSMGPVGPHPVGSHETCCNKTSISPALSFFMKNHGNLTIMLHPLTRWEILDHTTRAMFLGPSTFLNMEFFSHHIKDSVEPCLPR